VRVAVVAFDGFDELEAFVAIGIIDRLKAEGWSVEIASTAAHVTSMCGATVLVQRPLEYANECDAVLFAGGMFNRAIAESLGAEGWPPDRLALDPLRQTLGAIGSGTLLLARMGLLGDMPACADAATRPFLKEAGVRVLDEPFHARGPIGTAAGAMAAAHLAAWVIARGAGVDTARRALRRAAPIGDEKRWSDTVMAALKPFVGNG
jgi:transcriptional regulator GlxA family with amidase domain